MSGQASTILRWPLWSWRNLTVTAVAFLLLLFGLGRVIEPAKLTLTTTRAPLVTASPTPSVSSPTVAPLSAGPSPSATATAPGTTPSPSAVSGASRNESVTRLATAFAQAWSSSGRSQREWSAGIQSFVTPALAAGLAQTDPARVPATKVTGEAVLLAASATTAHVRVPTDGGSIVVTLNRALSGPWQVSDIAPAGQPPGAPTPDLRPSTSPAKR